MIVQMLFRDGDGIQLTDLPENLQAALAHELGSIRLVDKDTVAAVADEFVMQLETVGLVAPGSTERALDTLGEKINPDLSKRLKAEIAKAQNGDPWGALRALSPEEIVPIMETQSTQIAAILLSKLNVTKAAEALGMLPGERARRITFAMSQTASVTPEAVLRIGRALVEDHCSNEVFAFDRGPDSRLGEILNTSASATREDVLVGLDAEDKVFADDVRRKIFTFADIAVKLKGTDVPNCIRSVDPDRLNYAIAAAFSAGEEETKGAEFILANISQRMATQIRESAAESGTIKPKAGEAAMNEVTAAIRALVDEGVINFLDPADSDA